MKIMDRKDWSRQLISLEEKYSVKEKQLQLFQSDVEAVSWMIHTPGKPLHIEALDITEYNNHTFFGFDGVVTNESYLPSIEELVALFHSNEEKIDRIHQTYRELKKIARLIRYIKKRLVQSSKTYLFSIINLSFNRFVIRSSLDDSDVVGLINTNNLFTPNYNQSYYGKHKKTIFN